jgi:hypothetical protein
MKTNSKNGQWLGDMALQLTGDISTLVEMAVLNDITLTGYIPVKTCIKSEAVVNKRVTDYYRVNEINPATSIEQSPEGQGGIGFMAVGITFVVS